jgi:plastocyanin
MKPALTKAPYLTVAALAGLLAFCVAAGDGSAAQASPTPTPETMPVVTISNFAYSPEQLTITQGQTVRFVNRDDVAHTVTEKDGAFDSKLLNKDKSWTYTFSKAGTYWYYCTIHPSMKGSVTVNSR